MKIAFKNSKILMINGRTLTPVPGQGPEPGLHYVYTSSEGHGSISASPMSGKKDTLITLSNTPDQNYIFSKYTLNNVDLAGSSFLMPDEDAYVRGYFQAEVRTITVTQPSHGTITAPASAQIGSTVTLSCTPESGYALNYFTVNGTQIHGNTFVMPASNVTVSASMSIYFDSVTLNNQTWMAKNLAIDDGQGGIYHKTVNYGRGDVEEYYYTWAAAQRIANSIEGWHLPSGDDWYYLKLNIGREALRSDYGWSGSQGSNSSGFTALPAGSYSDSIGSSANFWTDYDTIWWYIRENDMDIAISSPSISVRLIKDS